MRERSARAKRAAERRVPGAGCRPRPRTTRKTRATREQAEGEQAGAVIPQAASAQASGNRPYAKISFSTTSSFLMCPTSFCKASMQLGRMSAPMSTYMRESPTSQRPSFSQVRT